MLVQTIHPMDSIASMTVYADELDDLGNANDAGLWRVVASIRQWAEMLIGEVLPTGSRYYADYWQPTSDFDFFIDGDESTLKTLVDAGWMPQKSYSSAYFGLVNVIIPHDYESWLCATVECKEYPPATREEAIAIFKRHGV